MTNQGDVWLSIRDAALRLGTSELTIRRRIKDGRLSHRLQNGKYFVCVPGDQQAEPPVETPAPAAPLSPRGSGTVTEPLAVDFNALLAEQTRLAEMAGRATVLEAQVRELERRNDDLHQNMVSLATRNGWLESLLEERERDIKLLTDSQPRAPWWRRIFGRNNGIDEE